MKVLLNPSVGMVVSCRGVSSAVKSSSENVSKATTQGYSNEEIYNAIMSFKRKISNVFTAKENPSQKLNIIG